MHATPSVDYLRYFIHHKCVHNSGGDGKKGVKQREGEREKERTDLAPSEDDRMELQDTANVYTIEAAARNERRRIP